jgi:HK97 family phage major capsid protein
VADPAAPRRHGASPKGNIVTPTLDDAVEAVDRILGIHSAAEGRSLTHAQAADYEAARSTYNEWSTRSGSTLRPLLIPEDPDANYSLKIADYLIREKRAAKLIHRGVGEGGTERASILRPGELRLLAPSDRLADCIERPRDAASIGAVIRAVVTGDFTGLPDELRYQSVGLGASGGFTVPDFLSSQIIDRARAQSVALRSGARTVPMESSELAMARLATGATVGWKAEGAAITAGDLAFERITFHARTLAALVWASVELMEDSDNFDTLVEDELGAALALELDRAVLFGSGIGQEPLGIAGSTGIGTTAVSGAFSYDSISTGVQGIMAANFTPDSLYLAPRSWGSLDRFKSGEGLPLQGPPSSATLAKYVTTSVPITQGGGSDTTLTIGKGSEILIGVRTQLRIEASREAADASNNAFSELKVGIRAYLRADVQLAHPAAFHTLTGVTN